MKGASNVNCSNSRSFNDISIDISGNRIYSSGRNGISNISSGSNDIVIKVLTVAEVVMGIMMKMLIMIVRVVAIRVLEVVAIARGSLNVVVIVMFMKIFSTVAISTII